MMTQDTLELQEWVGTGLLIRWFYNILTLLWVNHLMVCNHLIHD